MGVDVCVCVLSHLEGGEGFFTAAKDVYLQAVDAYQSGSSWLGAGIAMLRLGEYEDAEDALQEANVCDKSHAEVWGCGE